MALFRRRDKEKEAARPRASDASNVTPATSGDDWLPSGLAQRAPARGPGATEWVPDGVTGQQRRRSQPANPAPAPPVDAQDGPTAAVAPAAPVDAPAPPVDAPAADAERTAAPPEAPSEPSALESPVDDRVELHARIAALEDQIAAAKAADSDQESATIRALQSRLDSLEKQRSGAPAYPAPGSRSGTTVRILFSILLFIVIAGSPLFMSKRTICHPGGRPVTHWSVVKPFDDSGPPKCETELGGSVLLDSVGLK